MNKLVAAGLALALGLGIATPRAHAARPGTRTTRKPAVTNKVGKKSPPVQKSSKAPSLVPGEHTLLDFFYGASDGAITPARQQQLEGYLAALVPGAPHVAETARFLLRSNQHDFRTRDATEHQDERARAFYRQLVAARDAQADKGSLAWKQLLGAKAKALGKQFYVEGTLKQMKTPEIRHSELVASPVTNDEIAALGHEVEAHRTHSAALHELLATLHHALSE